MDDQQKYDKARTEKSQMDQTPHNPSAMSDDEFYDAIDHRPNSRTSKVEDEFKSVINHSVKGNSLKETSLKE